MAKKHPKTLKPTARGKGGGSRRGSARIAPTTRWTGVTTPPRARSGGGSRRTVGPMCVSHLMASLRRSASHLDVAFLYPQDMPTWMKVALPHMVDSLLWMTEGQPLSVALCLKAAYGSILDTVQNTAPSPLASKKHGSL